jgi:hypothetical protein
MPLIRLLVGVVALVGGGVGSMYTTHASANAHTDRKVAELKKETKEDYKNIRAEQRQQREKIHEIDKKTDRILTIVEERLGAPRRNNAVN